MLLKMETWQLWSGVMTWGHSSGSTCDSLFHCECVRGKQVSSDQKHTCNRDQKALELNLSRFLLNVCTRERAGKQNGSAKRMASIDFPAMLQKAIFPPFPVNRFSTWLYVYIWCLIPGFFAPTLDPGALGITTARVQPYKTASSLYKRVYL